MSGEIVKRLRSVPSRGNGMCCGFNSTIPNPFYKRCQDAADEIERLRRERLEWFLLARQLKDALAAKREVRYEAINDYLRVRGELEDPRDSQ